MNLDRRHFIASLGGASAVAVMTHEARADALEHSGPVPADVRRRLRAGAEPCIDQAYRTARKHKWYGESRMVTVNDLYAFEPNVKPTLDQFTDIIGRHFRQPKEGLGFDNTPVAHMWRSIGTPDHPL
jgi:hypothetical protein